MSTVDTIQLIMWMCRAGCPWSMLPSNKAFETYANYEAPMLPMLEEAVLATTPPKTTPQNIFFSSE